MEQYKHTSYREQYQNTSYREQYKNTTNRNKLLQATIQEITVPRNNKTIQLTLNNSRNNSHKIQ